MRLNRKRKDLKPGVTLIMVSGVLTILAAVSAGFYTIVVMQTQSATRYSDSVRASLLSRAGIADGVSRLREQAFLSTESPTDPWYTVDWRHGATRKISFAALDKTGVKPLPLSYTRSIGNTVAPHSDVYTLNISDAASKINVNACDNIGVLLDNLCRVVGPPVVAADLDAIQPRRWAVEGSPAGLFDTATNKDDIKSVFDLYYRLDSMTGRPLTRPDGTALYGDGYAIAGYRSRGGLYHTISDIKNALTCIARPGHPELEQLEREVKFAAIRDYLTVDSWIDTNTVCVGKFEWCRDVRTLIDRDKSWVADDPAHDPLNRRGSLRGSYLSIVNGHGAGQLRRIATNGIDWIQLDQDLVVQPGPISSYMIIAKEDAKIDSDGDPMTDSNGNLVDDPAIDYKRFPLCIHRAPININTASDKVLAAMFLGLNVQHGTPLALGTDADADRTADKWSIADPLKLFGRIPTLTGLKRSPLNSGKPVLDRPKPWEGVDAANYEYINNWGSLGSPSFVKLGGVCNEAHELAYRIISARQRTTDLKTGLPVLGADPDPLTADPEATFAGFDRGPFRSWDDLYFRVVKPWDDIRSYATLPDPALPGRKTIPFSNGLKQGLGKPSLAPMIMAHFNSNTDILKFNPNIEWIDRWGRNFTAMEPVMAFDTLGQPQRATGLRVGPVPPGVNDGEFYFIRSMRYRLEEMIDKTDLNRSTTEFTLDSGGIFEIQSVGQVVKNGTVLAERKTEALIHVYDVWRESTQRQFVQGTISRAANQAVNWDTPAPGAYSGTIARDGTKNATSRLALTTLPEPLVPLQYGLSNKFGGRLVECVDDVARDARGNFKNYGVPDVVANKILPALYDGQLVLATNVCSFNPAAKDTFLASFNGDLDTDTCVGNGREQAKTPENPKIRVCDTISLLGLLNDTEIDIDPTSYPVFGINPSLGSGGVNNPLGPLDITKYGNNVGCRQGDLRAEGVFCGTLGTACKDATLKYPMGDGPASAEKSHSGPLTKLRYQNFDPRGGVSVGMWFKPSWHANDHMEHEFFNGGSNGPSAASRGNKLCKNGYVQGGKPLPIPGTQYVSTIGWPVPDGTLWAITEDFQDHDMTVCIHSGTDQVPFTNLPPSTLTETPSFHTQPFRWSYVGAVFQYGNSAVKLNPFSSLIQGYFPPLWNSAHFYGFWYDPPPPQIDPTSECARNLLRPFISTYRYPEGSAGQTNTSNMWVMVNDTLQFGIPDLDGQPAAYPWERSKNPRRTEGCFSLNNVNQGGPPDRFLHIYRQQPCDTVFSVIDELKITKRALQSSEIGDIMTTSRYYLPANPADNRQQPTFTSQTLIQSTHGHAAIGIENVTVARVSWNVFTPRFMHEYKKPGTYSHVEIVGGKSRSVPIAGPFDYAQYNADIDYDHELGWKSVNYNPRNPFLGVNRLPPAPGKQSHYSKGVEVELLNDSKLISGYENSSGKFNPTSTFTNPDVVNSFYDPRKPRNLPIVSTNALRYRVRFKYPINPDADPKALSATVDPSAHFLLDTPVFDDISITYMSAMRITYLQEIAE